MRRRLALACVAVLVLAAGGCTKKKAEPQAASLQHYTQSADVTFEMDGHRSGSFKGTTKVEVLKGNGPEGVKLFVLGLAPAVGIAGGRADAYVQLKDFHGNGTYKAMPPDGSSKLPNDAYVTWFRPDEAGTPVEAYRYDKVAAPCTVKLSDDGDRGTATCESLAATGADDIKVTMAMTWKTKGKKTELMPSSSTTTIAR